MKHEILSLVAVPILLIVTGVIGYLTLENHWNFELASYSIFLFSLIYILILERVIPLKQEWKPEKKIIWTDIKHFIFSTVIFDAIGKTLALSFVLYLQKHFFSPSSFWDTIPFFAAYIIANLVGELPQYIYHRMSHTGNTKSFLSLFLWKIHSIHHLPTSMNWFKTNWIHPVNMLLDSLLKLTPILLLGFSQEITFLVGVTHIVVAYVSHANIRTKKSVLDYLIITPQLHHFHHSTKAEEAKNFGTIIPFWDLMFGTYYNRKGAVEKVGVMEGTEKDYPQSSAYLKQLIFPLTTPNDCCK